MNLDDYPIVTEAAKSCLNQRQLLDYRSEREECIRWLQRSRRPCGRSSSRLVRQPVLPRHLPRLRIRGQSESPTEPVRYAYRRQRRSTFQLLRQISREKV